MQASAALSIDTGRTAAFRVFETEINTTKRTLAAVNAASAHFSFRKFSIIRVTANVNPIVANALFTGYSFWD